MLGYDVRGAVVLYGLPGTPSLTKWDCDRLWAKFGGAYSKHRDHRMEEFRDVSGANVVCLAIQGLAVRNLASRTSEAPCSRAILIR